MSMLTTDRTALPEKLTRPIEGFFPFCATVVSLCSKFSARLFKEARSSPELAALAFWSRESQLLRLKEDFLRLGDENTILVPRGTVFQIPPSNVPAILAYGWLLSILTGNRTIIRVSENQSYVAGLICRIMGELLAEHDGGLLADTTELVTYGHDSAITSYLSSLADVRLIWGGDATVSEIRRSALLPHAFDVTFPDRISWAVINSTSYNNTTIAEKSRLAEDFYVDSYSFDQMACSSPRTIIWCGTPEECAAASGAFYDQLQAVIQRRAYEVDTGVHVSKLTQAFTGALELPAVSYRKYGSHITVVRLLEQVLYPVEWCGGGFFFQIEVRELRDIALHVDKKIQTLSYYGFSHEEMMELTRSLNGRGIDRIVPIGQALVFSRFWDGYDLLQILTKRVRIQ